MLQSSRKAHGGSWVVITGAISRRTTIVITLFDILKTQVQVVITSCGMAPMNLQVLDCRWKVFKDGLCAGYPAYQAVQDYVD